MSPALTLQARRLAVQLGGREVLHGVDLDIPAARWTAVVGPNGAGKSTLLQALAGLQPCSGEVDLQGRPLAQWPRRERARTLAWLGQGQEAPADLSVHDLVMLGRLPHQGWQATVSTADEQAVADALDATETWAWRARPVGTLSAGERQRVLLARALAVQAGVLLMDEPLVNLDIPHQGRWWQLVRQLVAGGTTVVSVLHEVSVALQADELVLLQAGRVVHQGPPADAGTRAALERVFDQRLAICEVQGQWVAVPRVVA